MYGYATDETPEYMPLTLTLAHKLTLELEIRRKDGRLPWVRPDCKSQVRNCIVVCDVPMHDAPIGCT